MGHEGMALCSLTRALNQGHRLGVLLEGDGKKHMEGFGDRLGQEADHSSEAQG